MTASDAPTDDPFAEALAQAPATPAGRQAAWWLASLQAQGQGSSLADKARFAPTVENVFRGATTDTGVRDDLQASAQRLGAPMEAVAFASISDFALEATLSTAKDRRWKMKLVVEEAPPFRIAQLAWERLYDFKLEVREAGAADALTMSDLERRCPIELGDVRFWFDRGERYFDFARLAEDCTVGLASVDGEPAAMTCGTRYTVRIGGALKTIVLVSHLRVLPEHQRKGLWGAANQVLEKYWPHVNGSSAYIAVDNAGMQHGFRHTPDKWPGPVWRLRLDCARLAGKAFGRPATPADASEIVARLNRFHAEEEMFVPYTDASLAARLARAPDLYGWDRLWLSDRALVGVWPAGRALRVVTERGGTQTHSDPGLVMDYAAEPGAEAELERLLRAWCGWLAPLGIDRLTLFTSPLSPAAGQLRSLADEVEPYDMWTPGVPVPAGAETRGLYVDPVYF
jgi:hypothetical protein